jgi:hypothetical protein
MKKILFISLLFISFAANSQGIRRLFGSSYFDIRTNKFGHIGGVNGTDTLGRWEDTTHYNYFKPLRLARWTTSGRPSSPLSGWTGFNTDSNRIDYYTGSAWEQPGTGGSGGSGTPGGSNTQFQYNNSSAFGGTAGLTWDNTNTGATLTKDALGVTQSATSGLILQNTTAAAAGAQQISPAAYFKANGWKINATAASQAVDFRMYTLPVQGSANPTGTFLIQSSINGGAYTTALTIGSDNILQIGNTTTGTLRLTTSTTDKLISGGNRSDLIFGNYLSARTSGTWTTGAGTTVVDPNTYTSAYFNFIHTTLPQINASYNTTNNTTFQTNSSGDHTITPSGGDLTVAGTASVNDQAYDEATWNGSTQVPTKNAVRDQLESIKDKPWSFTHAMTASTTDATPTNMTGATAISIPNNSVGIIKVYLVGNGGSGAATHKIQGVKYYTFNKNGGTLTIDAADVIIADKIGSSVSTATWQLTSSSNQPVIQVTGVAAININWGAAVEIAAVIN